MHQPPAPAGPDVPDDLTLRHGIRAGSVAAYEAAFARYYAPLCRYVFTLVQSDDVAEDIVRDLFVRLWEHRREWDVRQSLRAYLYVAARGRAGDQLPAPAARPPGASRPHARVPR